MTPKDFRFQLIASSRLVGDHADLSRVWPRIAHIVRQAFARNFLNKGSIKGQWPPRKAQAHMSRGGRIVGGHPLLILSGAMFKAATTDGPGSVTQMTPRTLSLGIDIGQIPYWRAQNFGYSPRNLPARTFLIAPPEVLAECRAIIKTEIKRQISAALRRKGW